MVNQVLCQNRLPASWIGRHPEKTCPVSLYPVLEKRMAGEPFTCTWDALAIPLFAISVRTGIKRLKEFFGLLFPSRHFLPRPVLLLCFLKPFKPAPYIICID